MKYFLLLALAFAVSALNAQNPVSWNFSSRKVADKTYEIHMTANIQPGWHLYSQNQPEDAIAIPTGFTINNNPLLKFDGKIKEMGSLEKFHDKKLDVSANQYSDKVVFVQVVKLKANAKTNLTGSVEFQTCNDEKCLPPKTVNFNVALK
ncbi:MAG TPA: protein-disulfide reductase DsbD domain-containing protein [Chitinophagaceae bacterium]|nr:protein-disulfide reductase DsbD domain-containing protein [Chitinophagaceae bacterium]